MWLRVAARVARYAIRKNRNRRTVSTLSAYAVGNKIDANVWREYPLLLPAHDTRAQGQYGYSDRET